MLRPMAVVALLAACLPVSGAMLASVSLQLPDELPPFCCYVEQDFSVQYTLLVTGGTGQGRALVDGALRGFTQEGLFGTVLTEGAADLTITTSSGSSNWYVPYFPGLPGPALLCYELCDIPFTFGVPETVTLSGYAKAAFSGPVGADPRSLGVYGSLDASVEFDGITGVVDDTGLGPHGSQVPAEIHFDPVTAVPEPSSLSLLLVAMFACAAVWRPTFSSRTGCRRSSASRSQTLASRSSCRPY